MARVPMQRIAAFEQGKGEAHWRTLGKLASVLGTGLIDARAGE